MKKLILALILAVVLTLTLATPAFAGPPEDKPGNMPGKAADNLLEHVRGGDGYWPHDLMDGALINGLYNPGKPMAIGVANVAQRAIYYIAQGVVPIPFWAGKP